MTNDRVREWTSAEKRKLANELNKRQKENADVRLGDVAKTLFANRKAHEVRDQARKDGLVDKSQRCAYGMSRGQRCQNTRADKELTWRKVPKTDKVLSHMAIDKWTPHLVCCSSHGHDPTQELSASNLPTSASPQPQSTLKIPTSISPPALPRGGEARQAKRTAAEKER
jgi:hypothetical protein